MTASPGAARFDDLVAGSAWVFGEPVHVLRAHTLDDVRPVLRAVEAATADGMWASGFVAFEAAAAFDAGFPAGARSPRVPLAWFALASAPRSSAPVAEPDDVALGSDWTFAWPATRYHAGVAAVRSAIGAASRLASGCYWDGTARSGSSRRRCRPTADGPSGWPSIGPDRRPTGGAGTRRPAARATPRPPRVTRRPTTSSSPTRPATCWRRRSATSPYA